MRKLLAVGIAVVGLVVGSAVPGQAEGWHGGKHRHHHGSHGHHHRSYGHRVFFAPPVIVGPRFFVGRSYAFAPPVYYYPRPYVYGPAAIVTAPPPVYVQSPQSWYYCQNPQGYYPYVQQCPGGWMEVTPQSQ